MERNLISYLLFVFLLPNILCAQNRQTEFIYGTLSPLNYNENKLFKDECGAEVEAIKVDFVTKDGSWGYITHINVVWEHNSFFVYKGKRYYISDFGPTKISCLFTFQADIMLGDIKYLGKSYDGKVIGQKQFRISAKNEEPSNFKIGDNFQFDLSKEDKIKYGSKEEVLKSISITNLEVISMNFNMFEHYLNVDKLLKEEVTKNHTTKKDDDFWSGKTAAQEEEDFWSGKTEAQKEEDFWSGKETSIENYSILEPKYDSYSKKYGYVDGNGYFVINPQFFEAEPFNNGVAKVIKVIYWGPIKETKEAQRTRMENDSNKKRQSTSSTEQKTYYYTLSFWSPEEYLRVRKAVVGYINKDGSWVIKETKTEEIWTTYGGE